MYKKNKFFSMYIMVVFFSWELGNGGKISHNYHE